MTGDIVDSGGGKAARKARRIGQPQAPRMRPRRISLDRRPQPLDAERGAIRYELGHRRGRGRTKWDAIELAPARKHRRRTHARLGERRQYRARHRPSHRLALRNAS